MRLVRFAAAVVALIVAMPMMAGAQAAPSPSDVPRLITLMRQLESLPPSQIQGAVNQLSVSDRNGLIWVINALNTSAPAYPNRASSTSTYSAPTYNYTPMPSAKPRSSYSSGYSYEPSTVITANPYIGTPISKYDPRVNKYSTDGATNPYTTGGGKVYGADGTYLGKLNANKYDPESVANPYGQYGSKYSSTSINNPYSQYGSKYSTKSATNPYATTPPRVIYGDTTRKW